MSMQGIIVMFGLIGLISAMGVAAGEDIDMGSATISLDLGSVGSHEVTKGESYSMDHKKIRFEYDVASASVNVEGVSDQVQLEVHRMSTSEPLQDAISERDPASGLEHCLMKSDMVPIGQDLQTEPYTIDGQDGILATINSDPENPFYIAAYSPDQNEGSGSIVCIIGSHLPWEITKGIFASIKTNVT